LWCARTRLKAGGGRLGLGGTPWIQIYRPNVHRSRPQGYKIPPQAVP